ncbi:3-phosphoshikimate 1-carboxyvinyltransferase [Collinsella sp. An268]|uniref:3-phosphoshikimate 1-carboxyvinyltransferase n=1 Tax=Collinsella sp. An268 TaxID=1965612 RepID=UPI000B37DD7C|nr:3-phosphoshikimate 1-carboxyvinyltransferase [Collinsella sp. An268]OUO65266.1 3-phosphoshikimate 1-carboxyvinyltransferase [Collinsella sp. An268]
MIATIEPRALAGEVRAISSKSVAHRLIIAAALANGQTELDCATTCDDIDATVRCLTALGARIVRTDAGYRIFPIPKSREKGILAALKGAVLDCGESGSTLRFMLPVACALGADAAFTGSERLGQRPLGELAAEIVAAGCDITGLGAFPLATSGRMRPGRFILPGDVSSQYISGILLAAPLLPGPVEILVRGRIESQPYVSLTVRALEAFGVSVRTRTFVGATAEEPQTLFIVEGEGYRTPGSLAVEGDWSNAAFWLCAGALGTAPLTVTGISPQSVQGDRAVTAALVLFGAKIMRGSGSITVRPDRLRGIRLSAKDIPDLVPVISVVAACAEGETVIEDCARLRMKESDRLATTTEMLRALGADVHIEGESLVIAGRPALTGGTVRAHNDHRIAMSAAVAAIRAQGPVAIEGAEAVAKSYPAFFEHYRALGGSVICKEAI